MPSRTSAPRRWLMSSVAGASALALTTAGLALATIPSSASTAGHDPTGSDCLAAIGSGPDAQARQRAFDAASRTYGVPARVLLGVSYMESRWDDHGHAPSTSGGYGPLHLTNVSVEPAGDAKGDGSTNRSTGPDSLRTAHVAADLTGLSVGRLTSDDAANICGGAALLASYQRDSASAPARPRRPRRGTTPSRRTAVTPASSRAPSHRACSKRSKAGESRRTTDGQQVTLTAEQSLVVPTATTTPAKGGTQAGRHIDCPATLDCQWVPAPYEQTAASPSQYGNHDLANREQNLSIDYIVIHDTEATWKTTLSLVQDPTYLAWNYSIRSRDGKVAQHLDAKDIGFQAGNWYVNMHSIGIEHEGFAAQGAQWYTESLYRDARRRWSATSPTSTRSSSTARTSSATTRCRASCRATSPACTGTRARSGTGSTT